MPTFLLPPGDELGVLLPLLALGVHELPQFTVVVDDPHELLHLSVVLLQVLVSLLLQQDHLGLRLVSVRGQFINVVNICVCFFALFQRSLLKEDILLIFLMLLRAIQGIFSEKISQVS